MLKIDREHINSKVSVCVPTYNHARFIAQCLDSILAQKTDFAYEILIGEDDSKDGTREICKKYAVRYPDRVRLFLNDRRNVIYIDDRPTGRWNLINLLKHAVGKYVALCEGDDYWTSPDKLQKQVDFLEGHPECAISFHNCEEFYDDGSKKSWLYCPPGQKKISTLVDLLTGCNFIPTCSVVFRNGLFHNFPEWYYSTGMGDWTLHILNAQHGDIGYINEVMGRHRHHTNSMWFSREHSLNLLAVVKAYEVVNSYFDFKYNTIIRAKLSNLYIELAHISKQDGAGIKALKYLLDSIFASRLKDKFSLKYLMQLVRILLPNLRRRTTTES